MGDSGGEGAGAGWPPQQLTLTPGHDPRLIRARDAYLASVMARRARHFIMAPVPLVTSVVPIGDGPGIGPEKGKGARPRGPPGGFRQSCKRALTKH
jgi:hypothetical protein